MGVLLLGCLAVAAPPPGDPELYQLFRSLQTPKAGSSLRSSLSINQTHELYRDTLQNPVTRLEALSPYDPTGFIGFCFGRAMAAQLHARKQQKLDPKVIFKLFVIGDLRANPEKPE